MITIINNNNNTITITITINGTTKTVTIPAPGRKACVNTRKSAVLGPLPRQFKDGWRVAITTKGHTQHGRVFGHRKVRVDLSRLPCGVYPMVIRAPGHHVRSAWRIWSLTGGKNLNRFWFPGAPHVSNFSRSRI